MVESELTEAGVFPRSPGFCLLYYCEDPRSPIDLDQGAVFWDA